MGITHYYFQCLAFLENQGNVVISLTEATCDFISSDKLVLSLKGGEM